MHAFKVSPKTLPCHVFLAMLPLGTTSNGPANVFSPRVEELLDILIIEIQCWFPLDSQLICSHKWTTCISENDIVLFEISLIHRPLVCNLDLFLHLCAQVRLLLRITGHWLMQFDNKA